MSRTVVVGGGLSGLVQAAALLDRGEDVRLLEASDRPGGVVRSEKAGGYLLELGPNTVRPTPEIWGLVRELALSEEARLCDPKLPRYIEFGGRLHALAPSPAALLTTRLLSVGGKLRLLREPFVPPSREPGESVHDFFVRRLGAQVAERLIDPFVSGIWAGDASRLSVASAFPMLARWEREQGSLLRGALASRRRGGTTKGPRGLLSFREGLETLPRALAGRLGPRVLRRTAARSLRREGGLWRIDTESESLEADRVVLATSAGEAARLIAPVDADAAGALAGIPHPPLVVLHLTWPVAAFPEPLSGFGHLVARTPGRRILGAVWSSSLFAGRAPEGDFLLTAFAGGARDPAAGNLSDAALLELAARELGETLKARGTPRLLRLTRYPRALPQYDFAHESRMAALDRAETRLPGLAFLGNYRGGTSVGEVVRNALRV